MSGFVFLLLYIYTQVLGIVENIPVWVATVPSLHALLLLVFAAVFGVTMAYQLFLWRSPKICSIETQAKGSTAGGAGTLGIFLIAQCPACASLGALFLPLSVLSFLSEYAVVLNLVSMGLLLYTLHYLGAFEKQKR